MTADQRPGFWTSWPVLLLAGPTIWILHFWIVYLWAEAACAAALPSDGGSSVAPLTAAATVVAVVAIAAFGFKAGAAFKAIGARHSEASNDPRPVLYLLGALLAGLSVIATVFVALPALVLRPC